MADSGSRDSLGGVDGVGEATVIVGFAVADLRFQMAMLTNFECLLTVCVVG